MNWLNIQFSTVFHFYKCFQLEKLTFRCLTAIKYIEICRFPC